MKKISTLAFLAFFSCLSAVAQITLGDISFSLGEGKKINPITGKITITFPNVTGVADPTATTFVIEGTFGGDDYAFDGIEGTFAQGITLDLLDFGLEPSTDYTLAITSVKVDGQELAAEGGYTLNFKTRGAERKMSWTFAVPEDEMAVIRADADADNGGAQAYWSPVAANQRYWVNQSLKGAEIMLDANNALSVTEDLTFSCGTGKIFIGDPTNSSWAGLLVFNATGLYMTIPDCKVGDVITFSGLNATKGSSSKQTCIQAQNGAAIAPEGIESSTGLMDSVWVSAKGTFKFESQVDGDITFLFCNFRMSGIEIAEAQPKLPRKYSIVAGYADGDNVTVLKQLVAPTEGTTGSTIKANYPYWTVDADGNVYTHGARGSEFIESFDLKNGEGDTTFVISYKKTDFTGAVYLSEGEDIADAVLCGSNNAVVRSSMAKAGYVLADTKLVTLQPGTYKVRAILFDASSTPNYSCVLTKGEGEENEIWLNAALVNFSEVESDLITITEPTDITLKAGGSDTQGLDALLIYASEDAPEDPTAIADVNAAQQQAVRKVLKGGRIVIQTEAGTVNVAGQRVK